MLELGISGGTFNPIHNGHLDGAQCALDQFGLSKVRFIPNGDPPHKDTDVLDKEARWEMVLSAVAPNPKFEASRIEIDRPGKSFTIDTLRALKQEFGPGVRLNLIIGIDNLEPIKKWHEADEIFKLCRILIAPRLTICHVTMPDARKILPAHASFDFIDAPSSSVSSTLIRQRIRNGHSVQYLVTDMVHNILQTRGHYRTPVVPGPATL